MLFSLQSIPEQKRDIRRSFSRSDSIQSRTFSSQFFLPSVKNDKSKTAAIPSKNLFTTVLKEETEEIIEEGYDEFDHTPLSREPTTNNKKPKTLPELNRLHQAPSSELAEENKLRGYRISQHLDDLQKLLASQSFELEMQSQFKDRRSNPDLKDRILRIGENVLGLFNIQFNVIEMTKQDSLMKVEKLKDKFALSRTLVVLMKEMSKFPYSFFKQIGLKALTFCQDVELYKDQQNPIIMKKLMSGIFPLAKLATPESIIDHFYQVVFSYLRALVPDLDTHWSRVYIRKSKTIMHISMNVVVTQSTKAKKNFFEEQWKFFKELVMNPNKVLKNESNVVRIKGFKLKDCMERVDSDGMTEDWWKKRGFNLVVGSLDHI